MEKQTYLGRSVNSPKLISENGISKNAHLRKCLSKKTPIQDNVKASLKVQFIPPCNFQAIKSNTLYKKQF